jgi:hypothetical protein
MSRTNIDEATYKVLRRLLEVFGEPIGDRPTTYGVPDERVNEEKMCEGCGCSESVCECGMTEARRGPTKKTAKKILRGTKTFKQKMKKVSGWAEDPAAAAAWMQHKATGKWPRED